MTSIGSDVNAKMTSPHSEDLNITGNHMDLNEIREHWRSWAKEFGTGLRATTKSATAKLVELDTLERNLRAIMQERGELLNILEVGCGNGQNCLNLLKVFPQVTITGIDFIEEMIAAANSLKKEQNIVDERLSFKVGDILDLDLPDSAYDVIFTDRCLINLNTDILQHEAIKSLAERLKPNGYLLMIENSQQTYAFQNRARELAGLPKRSPAEFNHFIDETSLLPFLSSAGLDLVTMEDFISLHDLVLYVLVPMTNGGQVDYAHPMVEAATRLNIALSSENPSSLGHYGQNRLYKCQRRGKSST